MTRSQCCYDNGEDIFPRVFDGTQTQNDFILNADNVEVVMVPICPVLADERQQELQFPGTKVASAGSRMMEARRSPPGLFMLDRAGPGGPSRPCDGLLGGVGR